MDVRRLIRIEFACVPLRAPSLLANRVQLILQIRTRPRIAPLSLNVLKALVLFIAGIELEWAAAHELAIVEEVVRLAQVRGEPLVQLIKLIDLRVIARKCQIVRGVQQIRSMR